MNDADDDRKRFEDWAVRNLPAGSIDLLFNTADQLYPDLHTDRYFRTWLAALAHARHGLPPVPEGFASWEDYLLVEKEIHIRGYPYGCERWEVISADGEIVSVETSYPTALAAAVRHSEEVKDAHG